MSLFYLGFIILNLGPIDFENETRCTVRLVRPGAYMGMRRGERALCDIENARKLVPDSTALATVSQTWQVMFDSPPNFSSTSYAPSPCSVVDHTPSGAARSHGY